MINRIITTFTYASITTIIIIIIIKCTVILFVFIIFYLNKI